MILAMLSKISGGLHSPTEGPFDPTEGYADLKKLSFKWFNGRHHDASEFISWIVETTHIDAEMFGPHDRYTVYTMPGQTTLATIFYVEGKGDVPETMVTGALATIDEAPHFLHFELPRKYQATETTTTFTKQLKPTLNMIVKTFEIPAVYQVYAFIKQHRGSDQKGRYTATIFAQDGWWSSDDSGRNALADADVASALLSLPKV